MAKCPGGPDDLRRARLQGTCQLWTPPGLPPRMLGAVVFFKHGGYPVEHLPRWRKGGQAGRQLESKE